MNYTTKRARTLIALGMSIFLLMFVAVFKPASAQPATETWMQLAPTGISPEGRVVGTGSAYDAVNDRLIIFSGGRNPESIPRSPDVLVLTNATGSGGTPSWIQLFPNGSGPDGRMAHTVVYDPTTNRIIVHGGCFGNCSPALSDVWVLTNANGIGGTPTWIQLPSAPVERDFHVSVYDSISNRMIVFGGQTGFHFTERNDVWILTDANGIGNPEWQELAPQGVAPAPRVYASGVYDPASNTLIIFGGSLSSYNETTTNDAWILSNANGLGGTPTWTQLSPAGTLPAARTRHSTVYDSTTNKMLVFGGTDGTDARFNDVWELTGANGVTGTPEWHQLAPTGCPLLGRIWAAVGYAPSSHQLIVAMGRGDDISYFNDVWVLKDGIGTGCDTSTAPTITVDDITKERNATGGWTLVFSDIGSASDAEDGMPSVTCTPVEGSVLPLGQTTVSCTATDSSGLSTIDSGIVTVIDTTPPAIVCPTDINGIVGQSIGLGSPTVSDIADSSPSVTNNTPASFAPGMTSVIWTAMDDSSNSASCTQKVTLTYIFRGFYSPVDNLPTVNIAKAGQAIPFKWSLQDANGNFVSDLATAASYGYGALANCSGSTDAVEEYTNTGSTSLRYDSTASQFILTSKTDKSWAGSCKIFTLTLTDGTKHQAKFNFTR